MRLSITIAAVLVALSPAGQAVYAEAPRPAAAKPVTDGYYAKRQQAKASAGQPAQASTGHASEGAAIAADGNATLTSGPAHPTAADATAARSAIDPYYQRRQTAARTILTTQMEAAAAAPGQYEQIQTPGTSKTRNGVTWVQEPPDPADVGGRDTSGDTSYVSDCADGGYAPRPVGGVLWNEIHSDRTFWANLEYLSWWTKGNFLPPLVTTSPIGTPQSDAGVLGEPGTSILFGNQRVNGDQRNGGRITIGGWIVGDILGIEGNYYALQTATTRYTATSDFSNGPIGDPILARPFFNQSLNGGNGLQDSLVLAFPNFQVGQILVNLSGNVNVTATSDAQSAGLGVKRLVGIDFLKDHRLFLVGGYRFFRLDEDLFISHAINPTGGPFLPGTQFSAFDQFTTTNQFHGGDFGLSSDLRRGRWVLESQAKLALGNMREIVDIRGQSAVFDGIMTTTSVGGLLTKPSNIGHYRHDQFVLIPEISVKLGWQVTARLRATVGYNFTYISRVARPGNEVDLVVDPTQATPNPRYLSNPTDFWLQGVTTGFEYRF